MSTAPVGGALRRDLEAQLRLSDGSWAVEAVRPLPLGHSGFTYEVRAARGETPEPLVLRLPPPGARPVGPADVARQGRIVAALHRRGLPVPAVVAMSAEPLVDGRPFVLFEMVAGHRVEEVETRVGGERIAGAAVDAMRRLHAVPVAETALEELPVRPEGEIQRWRHLQGLAGEDLGLPFEALRAALAAALPVPERPPCLVHADFHCGNLLFATDGPVVAMLDWEISELGQPLIDLACLAVAGMSGGPGERSPVPGPDIAIDRLAELYGADPAEFGWYCALTCYKYAAVYVYNLMLHRRGKRVDPFNEGLEPLIARLLGRGLGILAG